MKTKLTQAPPEIRSYNMYSQETHSTQCARCTHEQHAPTAQTPRSPCVVHCRHQSSARWHFATMGRPAAAAVDRLDSDSAADHHPWRCSDQDHPSNYSVQEEDLPCWDFVAADPSSCSVEEDLPFDSEEDLPCCSAVADLPYCFAGERSCCSAEADLP